MIDLFGDQEIKALSWREPYASLMLYGKIETRTWHAKYRGLVLICASLNFYSEKTVIEIAGESRARNIRNLLISSKHENKCGYAIAIGELVDSRPMKKEDEDACYVEYHQDLYCHVYKNVRAIKPMPWKGQLGFHKVTQEFMEQVEYVEVESLG